MGDVIEAAGAGQSLLRRLCTAAGLTGQCDDIIALFTRLCVEAGLDRLPTPPRWSGVTDDCTPFEFSTSFDAEGTRVRFLIEAQDDPASAEVYWAAGERLTRQLSAIPGADLTAIEALADLFRPSDPNALFAMWHAVDWRSTAAPLCKVYFNPAAGGRANSESLAARALDRLGFGDANELFRDRLGGDVITHLAVDLVAQAKARVKLYIRYFDSLPDQFDLHAARLGIGGGLAFADACRIVTGSTEPLTKRAVLTCYHLTAEDPARPSAMTLYLPLHPYAASDRMAARRIAALLSAAGLQPDAYRRVADALMTDRAADADGLHTYVGYRRSNGAHGEQITSYFSPRFFQARYGRLALDPDRFWPSAAHSH